MKKLLIKWNSTDGTENDGKLWLAANLLSEKYNRDMLHEITSIEIADEIINSLFWRYVIHQYYWWIRYGFKANNMYWYKIN